MTVKTVEVDKDKRPVMEFKAVTPNGTEYWIEYDPEIYIPHSETRVKKAKDDQ